MSAYQKLCAFSDEIALVSSTASVLGWDQETYMPANAINHRSRQLAWLSGRSHEMATGETYHSLLEAAENENSSDTTTAADLREWRYRFDRSQKLSANFIEDLTRVTSQGKATWAEARAKNDFSTFAPVLQKILDLNLQQAELWGYENEPYDALLAEYERGATTASINSVFQPLRQEIVAISQQAVEKSRSRNTTLPPGPYPIEAQIQFNQEVATAIGFNFHSGRIDTTAHPFCTDLGPGDVRLTTRYDLNDFTSSLFGVMHEAGHGMYEQNLRHSHFGRPSGRAVSLGIHESQSRLWENHVGISSEFWNTWFPRAQDLFPTLRNLTIDAFLTAIRRADYSLIRVEADEATYDLHILARFEIERQLIRKDLKIKDIPSAWNQQYQELLGLTPPNDTLGCLQDIHWSMGSFGYFPTYSLGNINAAQIFATARKNPTIDHAITKGNFLPLLDWLKTEIHLHGSTYFPNDLMQRATGRPPEPSDYLQHLKHRYTKN